MFKKKTIVFSCFALLFFLSAFSGFFGGLISGGVGCLVICGIFAVLALRSAKPATETNRESPQVPNHFSPQNKNSIPRPLQHDTVTADTPETPTKVPIVSNPAPLAKEIVPAIQPTPADEYKAAPIQSTTVPNTPDISKQFEYLEIIVAGVTFKNDKGPTRQTLLKKIKERSAPFDEYLETSLNQYEFEGELAYSVCVNDRQIGNVPASQVQYLYDNVERFVAITRINVYGGYRDENGYFKSYGATITVKLCLSDNS